MKNTIQTIAVLGLFSAASLSAFQAPANAADDSLPAKKVSYADLDISKPAGAQVLYRRIVGAAHQVCEFDGTRNIAVAERQRRCITQAVDGAVKSVDSSELTGLYSAHAPRLARN